MPRRRDVTNQRFGLLVAREYLVKEFEKKPFRRGYWRCDCDCGETREIPASNLPSGVAKSCGCNKGGGRVEKAGTRYGMLTVIRRADSVTWSGQKRRAWLCKCDCGKELRVSGKNLRSGHAKSCGCRREEVSRQTHLQDVTGERYERLVAVRRIPDDQQRIGSGGYAKGDWEWLCDCGKTHIATLSTVRAGHVRSCGCLGLETRPLNFHNEGHKAYADDPEYAARESLTYLVEIANQFKKIGIAFDLEQRFYKGEMTDVYWAKTMSRAECWAVEQAALKATQDYQAADVPKDLSRGGFTEFRFGMPLDEVIEMLDEMREEVKRIAWREFYDKYVLE